MDWAITDLIPHRKAMCLVQTIIEIDFGRAVIRSRVEESWPTCENGMVDPILLVEVFAQSAGVLAGWKKRQTEQQASRGWLVGIRHAELTGQLIPVQTLLDCHVQADYHLDNYAVFKGTVESVDASSAMVTLQMWVESDRGKTVTCSAVLDLES